MDNEKMLPKGESHYEKMSSKCFISSAESGIKSLLNFQIKSFSTENAMT